MSELAQKTITEVMDERDALKTKFGFATECIEDLRQELELVQEERDALREEKERAEYARADHQANQADLAHTSGEDCRLKF